MPTPDRTYLRGFTNEELVKHAREQIHSTELEIVLAERLGERNAVDAAYLEARAELNRADERIAHLERDNRLLTEQVAVLNMQLKI